jgi:hypothetical protein
MLARTYFPVLKKSLNSYFKKSLAARQFGNAGKEKPLFKN